MGDFDNIPKSASGDSSSAPNSAAHLNEIDSIIPSSASSSTLAPLSLYQAYATKKHKFTELAEYNPNLKKVPEFPLKYSTTNLYPATSPAITPDEPSKLQQLRTYASTRIKSVFDEMDKHPLSYYGGISLAIAGATMSAPAAAAAIAAGGIRLGATSLANHLVNVYGDEAKPYAKFMDTIGKTIFGFCVGSIIFAAAATALMPIIAAFGMPLIVTSIAVGVIASIVSGVSLLAFDKAITAVEDKVLGKENLEKNLDRKTTSTYEDLKETIKERAFTSLIVQTAVNTIPGGGLLVAAASKVAADHLYDWMVKGKKVSLTKEDLAKDIATSITIFETSVLKSHLPEYVRNSEIGKNLIDAPIKGILKETNTTILKSVVRAPVNFTNTIKEILAAKKRTNLSTEIEGTLSTNQRNI